LEAKNGRTHRLAGVCTAFDDLKSGVFRINDKTPPGGPGGVNEIGL
jgi:hypothetical protein